MANTKLEPIPIKELIKDLKQFPPETLVKSASFTIIDGNAELNFVFKKKKNKG